MRRKTLAFFGVSLAVLQNKQGLEGQVQGWCIQVQGSNVRCHNPGPCLGTGKNHFRPLISHF